MLGLQLFYAQKFKKGLARSLKMEAIYLDFPFDLLVFRRIGERNECLNKTILVNFLSSHWCLSAYFVAC